MEYVVNYPVNRLGNVNYNIQADLDAFSNSECTVMTIAVPKNVRSQVRSRWMQAVKRSRRNYIVESVDIGVQVRRH